MTLPTILAMAGCIALLVGLFGGGIKVREVEVPKINTFPRISSTIFGMVLIGLAVSMSLSPASASQQPAETSTPAPQPTATLTPSITPETSSLISWSVDPTGVCRDATGGYPRWSEYLWSLTECQEACKNNPNCQGFAMSKQRDYCQLLGSDGAYEASDPNHPDAQITHGDSSQPEYTCYIKKH